MNLKEALSLSKEEAESLDKLFSYRTKPYFTETEFQFEKKKPIKPNPLPFIGLNDLNNQNEQDDHDDNPPKPAIEIGIKWEF